MNELYLGVITPVFILLVVLFYNNLDKVNKTPLSTNIYILSLNIVIDLFVLFLILVLMLLFKDRIFYIVSLLSKKGVSTVLYTILWGCPFAFLMFKYINDAFKLLRAAKKIVMDEE